MHLELIDISNKFVVKWFVLNDDEDVESDFANNTLSKGLHLVEILKNNYK